MDPLRVLAVRRRVGADDLGDLGQGVGRPEVDRVEQRARDEERHGLEQPVVVVARVAVAAARNTNRSYASLVGRSAGFAWSRSWRT